MGKTLVVVESPAKAKTIGRYLGKDFRITASVGHIRDLPEKKTGVNVKKSFAPSYLIKEGKEKVVAELKKDASQADTIASCISSTRPNPHCTARSSRTTIMAAA